MNIIVTGGAGFIGSHLVRRLIQEGHDIAVVDCLHPYYDPVRKQAHLHVMKQTGPFQFYNVQLLDKEVVEALFQSIRPDAVIHLAALPGVAYSIEQPHLYVDYDIKATIHVLEAAVKSGCGHVIFASSSSVYGNKNGPCAEADADGAVISPYAAAKWSAESFCRVYESLYGLNIQVLRFFTVYGPWGRPDMAFGVFLKKLLAGDSISLFGEGRSRDFTYVDDTVEGVLAALRHPDRTGVFNIGSASPVTMGQLLDELNRFFPDMNVQTGPARAGDVESTWADIRKAKTALGFSPHVSFSEGVRRTVEWAREYESLL